MPELTTKIIISLIFCLLYIVYNLKNTYTRKDFVISQKNNNFKNYTFFSLPYNGTKQLSFKQSIQSRAKKVKIYSKTKKHKKDLIVVSEDNLRRLKNRLWNDNFM